MALFNVYRGRSKGRSRYVARIWQGEAPDGPQAIVLAAQAYRGPLRGVPLFAEPADDDRYAGSPHTIIEES